MTQETVDTATRAVGAPPNGLSVPLPDESTRKHRGGAPKGNSNSMKHGLRSARLPAGSGYIAREANLFQKAVEAAILDSFGSIDILRAALVQTSVQWLMHAMKLRRLLRLKADDLTIDQMVNFAERACRALAERDRCLVKIGLEKGDERHMTLYAALPDEPEPETNAPAEPPG
jgi:hypothetical protein